ncbi:hypothetical protein BSG18_41180 [Pseudomonas ogarae]|nr:hypothetical protein BSF43_04920 [Pseudomonas ogarae]PBJ19335.1 hypothetical protein BSG18_41180 [Pseudomonas ogarae]
MRSFCGLPKKSFGAACSTISPLSMNITRLAADDADKEIREGYLRYWERQREMEKADQENNREHRKAHEEMDREERKHYEEMEREDAKRRAEFYREREKAYRE